MKIRRLEIRGFKSFYDKTIVEFSEGISAVVGPNGCGKSNIVDAIRWVIGEQSPSRLRGRHMEDVIFNGANGHKPFGMAEVSVVFETTNGASFAAYRDLSEVMVTRRLFRSGESEYQINKTTCRLKDIQDLVWDTGLGSRNYAIIEQGKVSAVIDMKPEERRSLLEEAAGVSKIKNRKREAVQKMEQAQQNLLRVNDVLSEIHRQLQALNRQAAKARRCQRLKDRLRKIELSKACALYSDLEGTRAEAEAEHNRMAEEEADRQAELAALRARYDAAKVAFEEGERAARKQQGSLYELRERIQKEENEAQRRVQSLRDLGRRQEEDQEELALAKTKRYGLEDELKLWAPKIQEIAAETEERQALLARLEDEAEARTRDVRDINEQLKEEKRVLLNLSGRESELQNRKVRFESHRNELKRRGEALDRERESLAQDLREAGAALNKARGELEELRSERGRLKDSLRSEQEAMRVLAGDAAEAEKLRQQREREFHACRSRLNTLQELWDKLEYFDAGVRSFLGEIQKNQADHGGVSGMVADVIQTLPEYETAVEAALGPKLEAVLVDSRQRAMETVDRVRNRVRGRFRLLPLDPSAESASQDSSDSEPEAPFLWRHVTVSGSLNGLARRLLGNVRVADSLSEAVVLRDRTGHPVVTLTGEMVDMDGTLTLGVHGAAREGILSKKREIEENRQQASSLEKLVAELSGRVDQVRKELSHKQSRFDALRETLGPLQRRVSGVEQECSRLGEKRRIMADRMAVTQQELASLEEERLEMERKCASVDADLEAASYEKTVQEDKVADLSEKREACRREIDALKDELYEKQLEARTLAERKRHLESETDRTRSLLTEADTRIRTLEDRLDACREEQEQLFKADKESAQVLETLHRSLVEQQQELKKLLGTQESAEKSLKGLENQVRGLEKSSQDARDALSAVKLRLTENRVEMQHLLEKVRTDYGIHLDRETIPEWDLEDAAGREDEIEDLRAQIERLGPVNPMAIAEYDALSDRHQFLTAQKEDLAASIEDIHKAIKKIDQECRRSLLDTMDKVNRNLTEVFPAIFGGGTSVLRFTDPSRVLESGVEMEVHPPGKKVTVMGLLSGGEKALSALALLFAMSLINPSPFYLLDEVDAPLDEANIDRFNDLLKKMVTDSQIILVTHNRRTMEIADHLYGVTMERPGISQLVSVDIKELETP